MQYIHKYDYTINLRIFVGLFFIPIFRKQVFYEIAKRLRLRLQTVRKQAEALGGSCNNRLDKQPRNKKMQTNV